MPRGGVVSGSCSRDVTCCHIVPDLTFSPIYIGLCWSLSLRRHLLAALQQSTARSILLSWLEGSLTPVFRHDSHGFRRNPVHVAEVAGAPPNAADEIQLGKSPPQCPRGRQEPRVPSPTCSRRMLTSCVLRPTTAQTLQPSWTDSLARVGGTAASIDSSCTLPRKTTILLRSQRDQPYFPTSTTRSCLPF